MRLAEKHGAKLVTYDNATNDQYLSDVAKVTFDPAIIMVFIDDWFFFSFVLNRDKHPAVQES